MKVKIGREELSRVLSKAKFAIQISDIEEVPTHFEVEVEPICKHDCGVNVCSNCSVAHCQDCGYPLEGNCPYCPSKNRPEKIEELDNLYIEEDGQPLYRGGLTHKRVHEKINELVRAYNRLQK